MLSKMMKKFHNKKGFTMIELIAVMAVIAVLVTILLPQVSALRERAVKTEAIKAAKEVHQAIQAHELENGDVPTADADLTAVGYKDAGRDEHISSVTAATLNFTYTLVKQGYHATVVYDSTDESFTTTMKKDASAISTANFTDLP